MLKRLCWVTFWLVTAAGAAVTVGWGVVDAAWRALLLQATGYFAVVVAGLLVGCALALRWERAASRRRHGDNHHPLS